MCISKKCGVLLALLILATSARAQYPGKPDFVFTNLHVVTSAEESRATAINDLGVIAIPTQSASQNRVVLFDGTATVTLRGAIWAYGITNRNHVVGAVPNPVDGGAAIGAIWSSSRSMPKLIRDNNPNSINGSSIMAGSNLGNACMTNPNRGKGTKVLEMPGYSYGNAFGINDRGVVIGYVANAEAVPAIWNDKQMLRTIPMPAGFWGIGRAINNGGTALLSAFDTVTGDPNVGILVDRHGVWTYLSMEGVAVYGYAINNYETVAGDLILDIGQGKQVPFVWTREFGFIQLPLPDTALYGGATAINNKGQVVGWWVEKIDNTTYVRAALWTPR